MNAETNFPVLSEQRSGYANLLRPFRLHNCYIMLPRIRLYIILALLPLTTTVLALNGTGTGNINTYYVISFCSNLSFES